MSLLIAPVSSLMNISPISAFDSRDVLIPLLVNNPAAQKVLEANDGNGNSNADLFKSELTKNRDVVVPIDAKNIEADKKLTENGGNTLDNGIPPKETSKKVKTTSSNSFFKNGFSTQQLEIPFNDNIPAIISLNTEITASTPLATEVVADTQVAQSAQPVNYVKFTEYQQNAYSQMINAFQGGFNEALPVVENDNHIEFEA